MFLSVSSLDTVPRSDPSRRESRQHPPARSPWSTPWSRTGLCGAGNHAYRLDYRVSSIVSRKSGRWGPSARRGTSADTPGDARHRQTGREPERSIICYRSNVVADRHRAERESPTAYGGLEDDTAVIDCNGHTSESEPALLVTS